MSLSRKSCCTIHWFIAVCGRNAIPYQPGGVPVSCTVSDNRCPAQYNCQLYSATNTYYCCQPTASVCATGQPALLNGSPQGCTPNAINTCPTGYTCTRNSNSNTYYCCTSSTTGEDGFDTNHMGGKNQTESNKYNMVNHMSHSIFLSCDVVSLRPSI